MLDLFHLLNVKCQWVLPYLLYQLENVGGVTPLWLLLMTIQCAMTLDVRHSLAMLTFSAATPLDVIWWLVLFNSTSSTRYNWLIFCNRIVSPNMSRAH